MSTSLSTATCACHTDPAPHGYFSVADLRERYGWGETKTYATINDDDFPDAIVLTGRALRFPKHLIWAWETPRG